MNLYFGLFAMLALLITPVEARLRLTWDGAPHLFLRLYVSGAPLRIPQGRQKPARAQDRSAAGTRLAALLKQRKRIFRCAHLRLRGLKVRITLAGENAAATALVFAAARLLWQTLALCGTLSLQGGVRADFRRGQTCAEADCIIFTRLGNLVLAAILWYAEYAKQAKGKEDGYATAASH